MDSIIASSVFFFFFLNFSMFVSVQIDEYWDWQSLMAIVIIDLFYVLLVCGGLWIISHS